MLLFGTCSAIGHVQGACRHRVPVLFTSLIVPVRNARKALRSQAPPRSQVPQERAVDKNNGRYGKSRKNAKKNWKSKDGRSPEEIRARRKAEMDARKEVLINGIRDAFGDWEAFLRASNSGNLRRFSVYNRLYLYAQNPKASYVATANSWHRIGRRVTDKLELDSASFGF